MVRSLREGGAPLVAFPPVWLVRDALRRSDFEDGDATDLSVNLHLFEADDWRRLFADRDMGKRLIGRLERVLCGLVPVPATPAPSHLTPRLFEHQISYGDCRASASALESRRKDRHAHLVAGPSDLYQIRTRPTEFI